MLSYKAGSTAHIEESVALGLGYGGVGFKPFKPGRWSCVHILREGLGGHFRRGLGKGNADAAFLVELFDTGVSVTLGIGAGPGEGLAGEAKTQEKTKKRFPGKGFNKWAADLAPPTLSESL
jgi:hypothetical protein